jgi:hypothetical protein
VLVPPAAGERFTVVREYWARSAVPLLPALHGAVLEDEVEPAIGGDEAVKDGRSVEASAEQNLTLGL